MRLTAQQAQRQSDDRPADQFPAGDNSADRTLAMAPAKREYRCLMIYGIVRVGTHIISVAGTRDGFQA